MTDERKKICRTCKDEKPLSDFSPKRNTQDGLTQDCKQCLCNYTKERMRKLKEGTIKAF